MGMVVKTISFGINGIDGYLVEVEASSTRGMPKFDLVGLPDASVKGYERYEELRAADLLLSPHL